MEEDMEEDDTAVPHAPTPSTAPRPHLSARLYPTASTHGDGGLPMFHGEVEGVRNDDYEDNNPYIASGILGEDAFGGEGDNQQGAANESSAFGHLVHESIDGSAGAIEYVPHGQYLQNSGEDDPMMSENVPTGQDVQSVSAKAPNSSEYLPATHIIQLVCDGDPHTVE